MSAQVHKNLERDISFLKINKVPQLESGLNIKKLNYEGSSENTDEMLTDDHVQTLTEALKCNQTFNGPLILKKNKLTDLVSTIYVTDC